jgi:hypothetical protein
VSVLSFIFDNFLFSLFTRMDSLNILNWYEFLCFSLLGCRSTHYWRTSICHSLVVFFSQFQKQTK